MSQPSSAQSSKTLRRTPKTPADTIASQTGEHDEGATETKEEGVVGEIRAWIAGRPISREAALVFGLVLPAMMLGVNMWRVRAFTIDDSYISYRYARNLAQGLGLVYNAGERIEGYTNFLWTVLLAGGIRLGFEPDVFAKVLGALAAFGALGLSYVISARLKPFGALPAVSPWLFASTIVFTGYAVFGLETAFFVCLLLGGTLLFLREVAQFDGWSPREAGEPSGRDAPAAFPWSGLVFGLAGITRPEAPMFIGLFMLLLGKRIFGRQNLIRGALFAAPVAALVLFRHSYYGTWLPNTLGAKTGNLEGQIIAGRDYVQNYMVHAGAVVWLGLIGSAIGVVHRRRDLLAITAVAFAVIGYVLLVGGDWMPFFRFMAPFEPFCFLLVDVGVREIADRRERVPSVALAAFVLAMIVHRGSSIRVAQRQFLEKEKRFWDMAAGGTAKWFLDHGKPGEIAIGDIGYVGYTTNYPILDLLGLVDPVIAKLPGGYTRKLGPGFLDRFFTKSPEYMLLISSSTDCRHPSVPGSQVIFRDPRFLPRYQVAGKVPLDGGFAWCIYERKSQPSPP